MRKSLSDGITEIGEQIGLDTVNITAHKERVKRWVNDTRKQLEGMPYDWRALEFIFQRTTQLTVTAGTAYVGGTGGLTQMVTGSGTTWTNLSHPYDQYYITIGTAMDAAAFRVRNIIDDTHLVIDAYADFVASGESYVIYNRYFTLPYKPYRIKAIYNESKSKEIEIVNLSDSWEKFKYFKPNSQGGDSISYAVLWGNNEREDGSQTYSITTVANSHIVSASVTNLLQEFSNDGVMLTISATAGFRILNAMSPDTFYVDPAPRVSVTTAASTAYNQDQYYIQFLPLVDTTEQVSFYGYRSVHNLMNDNDLIEDGWWEAVRAGAIVRGFEYLKRPTQEKQFFYDKAVANLVRSQANPKSQPRIKPYFNRDRYSGYF